MLICLPGRESLEDDGPIVNPRPDWEWPSKKGPVTQVATTMGLPFGTNSWLKLEIDRLRWYDDDKYEEKRGFLELTRCDVHADVARIHGTETPVLELSYASSGKDRVLKLKFSSLDDMNDWRGFRSSRLRARRGRPRALKEGVELPCPVGGAR